VSSPGLPDNPAASPSAFTGQVWPGDELTLTGRVERVEAGDGVRLAHLVLTLTR
jgi:hypothetical protein